MKVDTAQVIIQYCTSCSVNRFFVALASYERFSSLFCQSVRKILFPLSIFITMLDLRHQEIAADAVGSFISNISYISFHSIYLLFISLLTLIFLMFQLNMIFQDFS